MKPALILVAVVACLLLPACASTPSSSAAAEPDPFCERYDCEKMNRISRANLEQGNRVMWVNPPLKPAKPSS